jgi:hypothetical protein
MVRLKVILDGALVPVGVGRLFLRRTPFVVTPIDLVTKEESAARALSTAIQNHRPAPVTLGVYRAEFRVRAVVEPVRQ